MIAMPFKRLSQEMNPETHHNILREQSQRDELGQPPLSKTRDTLDLTILDTGLVVDPKSWTVGKVISMSVSQ